MPLTAYACLPSGEPLALDPGDPPVLRDDVHRRAFGEADWYLAQREEKVDGCLDLGALQASKCLVALSRTVGRPISPGDFWDPEAVEEALGSASGRWLPVWSHRSARSFLETTAALGLGICFD